MNVVWRPNLVQLEIFPTLLFLTSPYSMLSYFYFISHYISDISFLSFIKSISLWLNSQQSSYLFLILSLISEFGSGTGWTLYPPLSTSFMSLSPSSTGLIIFSLLISGISSCLTSLNFWTTILNLRSYYLTLKTMPLFPYSLFITASMLLLTLPILSGALLLILSDLHSNTLFFDPIFGGDPIFYQHLFWFFGHPEVHILIIPAFGIISIIISGILQNIIFGNQSMIFAMSSISLLGSLVWGHHMYTVGLETDTRAYFTAVTILISLPTGTKIFNWLSTYLGNPPLIRFSASSPYFTFLFLLISNARELPKDRKNMGSRL